VLYFLCLKKKKKYFELQNEYRKWKQSAERNIPELVMGIETHIYALPLHKHHKSYGERENERKDTPVVT